MSRFKIVIICPGTFTERWNQYYCIDELQQYFDVEYWDCSSISSVSYPSSNELLRDYVHKISSKKQLADYLSVLPVDSIVIPMIHFYKSNWQCHKIIAKYFKHIVQYDIYTLNVLSVFNTTSTEIKTVRHTSVLHKMYNSPLFKIVVKLFKYRNFQVYKQWLHSYLSIRNEIREQNRYDKYIHKIENLYNHIYILSTHPNKEFHINSPDYEKYLEIKDLQSYSKEKYVVYIDQYFPYHSDFTHGCFNQDTDNIATRFYDEINNYFDKVEDEHNCKVVIAAHPTANYPADVFHKRNIVYFKTAELIKDCYAVCLHFSVATSLAILFDKPIEVISSDLFNETFMDNTKGYAKALGMQIHNISEDKPIVFKKVSQAHRDKYLLACNGGNEPTPNIELYVRHFSKIHKLICNSI